MFLYRLIEELEQEEEKLKQEVGSSGRNNLLEMVWQTVSVFLVFK